MISKTAILSRQRDVSQPVELLNANEALKLESNYLRGTIAEGLDDRLTYAVSQDDTKLLKFFGVYQQDDRDLRDERRRQKLEPAYQFMVRLRLPGGALTSVQWLKLDELAREQANGGLRITDRQTFQFHGVTKPNLRPLIQGFREVGLDSRAACGDDNRGVMASPNPELSAVHDEVYRLAQEVSTRLRPRTTAYDEIWYGQKGEAPDREPLYGPTYLPRKFKIGFAVPPSNDVDIYTHDLGFIAIAEGNRLLGFNVLVGGGMGRSDNAPETYPRLGDVIGFVTPDQVLDLAEKTISIQRDYGDRVERSHARFKYTIDDRGVHWFTRELEGRLGIGLEPARPFHFERNTDDFGWVRSDDGFWHYTLFVLSGRIKDRGRRKVMSALRALARSHDGGFRLTPNQNVVISRVPGERKREVEDMLAAHGLAAENEAGLLQRSAIACVAFPTCGLAMAESERYLPKLIEKIEALVEKAEVSDQPITIRMSGCPNGCSRPYVAEIGFSGRAPGKYNLYLGGGAHGQRLNTPFLDNVDEGRILAALGPLIDRYAAERRSGETFGDFVIRSGIVVEVKDGRTFNSQPNQ